MCNQFLIWYEDWNLTFEDCIDTELYQWTKYHIRFVQRINADRIIINFHPSLHRCNLVVMRFILTTPHWHIVKHVNTRVSLFLIRLKFTKVLVQNIIIFFFNNCVYCTGDPWIVLRNQEYTWVYDWQISKAYFAFSLKKFIKWFK